MPCGEGVGGAGQLDLDSMALARHQWGRRFVAVAMCQIQKSSRNRRRRAVGPDVDQPHRDQGIGTVRGKIEDGPRVAQNLQRFLERSRREFQ